MKKCLVLIILITLPTVLFNPLKAQVFQETDSIITVVVKPGDWLSKIAERYLDTSNNWKLIYELNKDFIQNPDRIYVGQKLKIPVINSTNPVADITESAQKKDTDTTTVQPDSALLNKFRKAFESLTNDMTRDMRKDSFEYLTTGGMVLDETHSKLGNDFYNIFYNNWEKPEGQVAFTITVSERPTPSLGTIVIVKIDGRTIFQHRLEPRFYKTQEAAKTAVYLCRQYLNTHMLNKDPYYGL